MAESMAELAEVPGPAPCPGEAVCAAGGPPACAPGAGEGCGVVSPGTAAAPGALHRRICMEQALRRAVAAPEHAFRLLYQPKVNAAHGRTDGVEALLRWHDPHLGPVSPAEFIPLAEETGLVVPLGEWVLRQACIQAGRWRAAGATGFTVAVNVSPAQFRDPGFPAGVHAALAAGGVPPAALELELTEGVLMDDEAGSEAVLRHLHGQGVAVALDDFGTGYSSLAYLKRLPLHRLKVDRAFVADLGEDPRSEAIARAVIDLGHGLGLQVTAEGVETAAQREWLAGRGCDELQGFGIAMPLSAAAAGAWLRR